MICNQQQSWTIDCRTAARTLTFAVRFFATGTAVSNSPLRRVAAPLAQMKVNFKILLSGAARCVVFFAPCLQLIIERALFCGALRFFQPFHAFGLPSEIGYIRKNSIISFRRQESPTSSFHPSFLTFFLLISG